jgi:hypothetical protein
VPVVEALCDFLVFGGHVIMPEEGIVKEQGKLHSNFSVKMLGSQNVPIQKIITCLFH